MVFAGSFIKCIDNTGAKVLEVLEVSGYPKHVPGYAGDEIKVIVHHGISGRKARVGFRYRALIVQCSSSVARPFGETVKGRNLAVLLRHDENIPLGNRFSRRYAFFREVKEKGWLRVSLLASKFILKIKLGMESKKYYCTQYLARHHLELFNVDLALRGFVLKSKFFYSPFESFETQMYLNEKSPSEDFVKGLTFVKKFLCCTDQHKQKFSKKLKAKNFSKLRIRKNTNLKINAEFPLVKFYYFIFNVVKFISKKELDYNAYYSGLNENFRLQYSNLDELSLFDKFSYFGWKGSLVESISFSWRTEKNRVGIAPIFLSIYKIYKK